MSFVGSCATKDMILFHGTRQGALPQPISQCFPEIADILAVSEHINIIYITKLGSALTSTCYLGVV